MKKKMVIFAVLLAAVVTLSGCTGASVTPTQSSQQAESNKQEDIQKRLTQAVPVPKVTNSTTRKAIAERTKVFDANDKVTYVYLVSYGKVMAFYPVKGQVVSLRSYLTPMENIVDAKGQICSESNGWGSCSGTDGDQGYLVSAPDVDGTYGDNPDGIFFFTADTNAYVEWRGDYMVSDQPLKLSTQPELVREVK